MSASVASFSEEMTSLVGRDHVVFDPSLTGSYCNNLYGYKKKCVGVISPSRESQVESIVQSARKHGIPLYPLSKGKNWGLGSRLPVEDDHVIIDLGRLTRISDLNEKHGIVTIQAGVTQEQLSKYLLEKKSKFFLNVTGSSKDSSIVGNALERGVAHYGCRVEEILSLKLVLGNGQKLNCGAASVPSSKSCRSYPYGIGPDLRGLFFQSNFGIVTSASIKLLPRRESIASIAIEPLPETGLHEFVSILPELYHEGVIPGNLHISNIQRRLSVVVPLYARQQKISMKEAEQEVKDLVSIGWSASFSLPGNQDAIESSVRHLKQRLEGKAKVSTLMTSSPESFPEQNNILAATRGTYLHANGIPSDDAIYSLGYAQEEKISSNPVKSGSGTLFVVPILPFDSCDFINVVKKVEDIFKKYRFKPFMTFNLVEASSLEGVINLTFDRSETRRVEDAHNCILEVFNELLNSGYPPQRSSIFQMPHLKNNPDIVDPGQRQTMRALKRIFDPDNIIARGRYAL